MHLLKCLLTIGAIPESLFIIGRHEWILQAYPDIMPLFHRILHHSIETVYQQSRPVSSRPTECPPKKLPDLDQSGVPKGSVKLSTPPVRRALRWPYPDKTEVGDGISYRFYWDEWADNIPVCQTVDDLFTLCDTLLNVVGVNIGLDASLVAKLASIGCKSLADDQSPANVSRWLDLLKRLLVPSLSLGDANSSVVESVWSLLKQYPIRTRYNVYAEWYEGSVSRLEPVRKAFARTRLETLSKMKRLSLTNIPQMAKSLAKIAYPSPGVVCKVALLQIESYSNLIEAFVECAKYFTDLGYDVLVWSVLSSLGGQQRSRTQETSVLLTSKWLQALSRFSGKVFRRYSNMDPSPVLRYVHSQLLKGNSTDLVILRELIGSMGGVVSDLDFTDAQLRAMTGGELLRRETLVNLGDKRASSVRSAERLMKALAHSNLAGQLLINMAQYRQNAIYSIGDGSARIKYLSAIVDDTHQVLLQYLDLLRSNLDPDTFDRLVPDIIQLMRDYGLDANLAFTIRRASIRWEMKAPTSAKDSAPQAARAAADADGDVAMEPAPAAESGSPGRGAAGSTDAKPEADTATPAPKTPGGRVPESLAEALAPLIEEIPSVMPHQTWRYISPACYVFFWSLQLGNLVFPQDSYLAEGARLKKQAEEVMKDRTDMTRAGMNKKTQKRNEILDRQKHLLQEANDGITRFSKARLHVGRQVGSWFPADISKADATSDTLLEECILPRLQLSALDAEYCFRMIKFLHEFSAPNFKLMSLYNRLFNHNRLRAIIFTCTVREAEHLARFLKLVLGDLSKWHGDKAAYEKEALGLKDLQGNKTRQYLGFATAFDADGKPTEFVEHDPFRELLFRWHKELNTALRSCLNGMEWMHIRNAISILKGVIDYFPAINFMAEKFLEQLKTITERESASKNGPESEQGHRVDLAVTAQTTYSELQKRKSKWILVQAFRPGVVSASARAPGQASTDGAQKSDAKDENRGPAVPAGSSLRATAPEFKPNGARVVQQPPEVEDGEVKDSKAGNGTGTGTGPTRAKDPDPPKALPDREPPRETSAPAQKPAGTTGNNNASSRPSTPKPAPAPAAASGPRQDQPKFSTLPPGGHGLPNRPELPSRPDVPIPRFGPGRHDRREIPTRDARDYRDNRESRDQHHHQRDNRDSHGARERDYRTPEGPRSERPRDFPPPPPPPPPATAPLPDRRAPPEGGPRDPGPRDAGWPSDRDRSGRPEPPPPRWHDHGPPADRDSRPTRERAPQGAGRPDPRPARGEIAVSTPPSTASQEPPINPERARIIEAERPEIINPARAALMNDTREPSGRQSPRDQPRERPPRTESPRRTDRPGANAPPPDNSRDDRHGRHRYSDRPSTPRESHGDVGPSHSRADRNADREDRMPGPREPPYGGPSRPDHEHGRLSQQDPNYGRLNPIQSVVDMPPGPPSGPRGRGGRNAARVGPVNGPPPMRTDNRFGGLEPIRPPSPERHPPTGPSAGRSRRGQYDNGNVNSPTSSGPPAGAMHPDRMRHLGQQASGPPPPPPPAPPAGGPSAIHPDRLSQIAAQPAGPGSHPRPPMNTPDRPSMSAPNSGSRPTPTGPSGDYSTTPTGPAAANDRLRSGGRQLRGIQNTLDKASADNARGPGPRIPRSRPSLAGSDAQILAGSSPVSTPVHERPDSLRDSSRRDMSTDRMPRGPEPIQVVSDSRDGRDARDARGGANGDDYGSSRSEHDRNRREHHRSDRGSRPSRRSSRERSPDRERERERDRDRDRDRERDRDRDRDPKESRDYRERRSSGALGGGSRDDRDSMGAPSRRSLRESTGNGGRDMAPPPPRDSSSHRSGHHRNEGPRGDGGLPLGGRGDDYGRGGSSRGAGPPPPPSSRDPRSRLGDDRGIDDRARKRRSEGVDLGNSHHQEKRQRR